MTLFNSSEEGCHNAIINQPLTGACLDNRARMALAQPNYLNGAVVNASDMRGVSWLYDIKGNSEKSFNI